MGEEGDRGEFSLRKQMGPASTTRACMIALHQTARISNQFWELSRWGINMSCWLRGGMGSSLERFKLPRAFLFPNYLPSSWYLQRTRESTVTVQSRWASMLFHRNCGKGLSELEQDCLTIHCVPAPSFPQHQNPTLPPPWSLPLTSIRMWPLCFLNSHSLSLYLPVYCES